MLQCVYGLLLNPDTGTRSLILWSNARYCGCFRRVCDSGPAGLDAGTERRRYLRDRDHGAHEAMGGGARGTGWPERLGIAGAFKTAATEAY